MSRATFYYMRRFYKLGALFAAFFAPALASAHEVYVLSSEQIQEGLAAPAFNEIAVALGDFHRFVFWGFVAVLTVFIVFFASIARVFENAANPFFARLRRYSAPIARVTVGLAFIASGYYQASYGPELPLAGA